MNAMAGEAGGGGSVDPGGAGGSPFGVGGSTGWVGPGVSGVAGVPGGADGSLEEQAASHDVTTIAERRLPMRLPFDRVEQSTYRATIGGLSGPTWTRRDRWWTRDPARSGILPRVKPHRDDLGAAHERIRQLEAQVEELKGEKAPGSAKSDPPEQPKDPPQKGGGASYALLGFPVLILLIGSCIAGSTRACIACNASETDSALKALQACPAAKESLGEDIGWSMMGCSNYESGTGGDPLNGGCHSSADYTTPVSGTKGRGSYSFSTNSPAKGPPQFTGGTLRLQDGSWISIRADGTCSK